MYLKLKWLKRNNGGSWANCWFTELATGWMASRILIGFLLDLGCFSVTWGWPHIFLLELTLELPVTCEPLKLKFAKNPNTSSFSATLDAQQPHGTAASVEICVECVLHHSKASPAIQSPSFCSLSLSLSFSPYFSMLWLRLGGEGRGAIGCWEGLLWTPTEPKESWRWSILTRVMSHPPNWEAGHQPSR